MEHYYWYQGARGDVSNPLTSNNDYSALYVCPSTTTTYWCRVVENGCYTDTQGVTLP